jgi:hypothetical protein
MSTEAGLLPEGSVLVHVGPYKTGTTAIQSSLHEHRAELAAAGVTYPGSYHRQMRPSWALLGRSRRGNDPVPMREWEELVAECRAAPGRVVLSSEDFSSADRAQAGKLVDDLGRGRVHVLCVVRRLDRLLPSSWQERVKSVSEVRSYDEWLEEVLSHSGSDAARIFWGHQSVAAQVALWTSVLPPARMTLAVADEDDPGFLRGIVEQMLGLPPGTLISDASPNTSLSWNRAELVRAVNAGVHSGQWSERLHKRLVYAGLVKGLQAAPRDRQDVPIPSVPEWAAERLRELSDRRVCEVTGSGVRVIGDPERLHLPVDGEGATGGPSPGTISIDAAVSGLSAMFDAWERRQPRRAGRGRGDDLAAAEPELGDVP